MSYSYRQDREAFIACMAAEGLPHRVTLQLLREATGINRRAELACSSEAADRDRVPCPRAEAERKYSTKPIAVATAAYARYPCLCDNYTDGQHDRIPRIVLQDWRAEQRIAAALEEVNATIRQAENPDDRIMVVNQWTYRTDGDPRGYTLRVIPPSYADRNAGRDRFNQETIGVPAGPSGLRF